MIKFLQKKVAGMTVKKNDSHQLILVPHIAKLDLDKYALPSNDGVTKSKLGVVSHEHPGAKFTFNSQEDLDAKIAELENEVSVTYVKGAPKGPTFIKGASDGTTTYGLHQKYGLDIPIEVQGNYGTTLVSIVKYKNEMQTQD